MNWKELKAKIKNISFIGNAYNCIIGKRKVAKIWDAKRKLLPQKGYDLAERIEHVLSEHNVNYYMDFGSLLGIIRSNGFLNNDTDIDYSIYISSDFGWDDLEKLMSSIGMKKKHQYVMEGSITEQTYEQDMLTVDFFAHFDNEKNSIEYVYFLKQGKKYKSVYERSVAELKMYKVCGTKKIIVRDKEFTIPEEPEKYLESIYTENWRTPDPNWDPEKGPAWNELESAVGTRVE